MSGSALSVFIAGSEVGDLARSSEGEIIFRRKPGTAGSIVSLAFPEDDTAVGSGSGRLHPVFDQNLPEGVLRERIEAAFARELPGRDDLTLLKIVGKSLIGRMRFAESSESLGPVPEIPLGSVISGGIDAALDMLIEQYAAFSGVSGAQPKVLVRDGGGKDRFTVRGTTHILKTFDPADFPDLGANEFACLRAAARAGLDVPEAELSADGRWIAVKRFDIDPAQPGGYLAFEDMCSLGGAASEYKYIGSYEQIAKLVKAHSAEPAADLDRLFLMVALTCALRNGDGHRKNFGMLYGEDTPPRLAPAFDIVSTAIYPRLSDRMALMIEGKDTWPGRKQLERFGMNSCMLSRERVRELLDHAAESSLVAAGEAADIGMSSESAAMFASATERGAKSIAGAGTPAIMVNRAG